MMIPHRLFGLFLGGKVWEIFVVQGDDINEGMWNFSPFPVYILIVELCWRWRVNKLLSCYHFNTS